MKEGASQVVFVCIFSVYSKTATTTLFACTKYFRGIIFRSNFSFSQLYFWLFYIVPSPLCSFFFYLSRDFSSEDFLVRAKTFRRFAVGPVYAISLEK